ncbi:MAG: hypothetical protein KDD50_10800 [Bdellovibrionales bacterium]|nr:hypothetical protein [Bdellovibrionales bacterium]
MKVIKGFISLIVLMSASMAFSQTTENSSFEEERLRFEKHLFEKANKAVSLTLPADSYVLNVGVKMRPIPPEVINIDDDFEEPLYQATKPPKDVLGEVPLTKLGVWTAPSMRKRKSKQIVKRVKNFMDFVDAVNVDLIVDEKVPADAKRTVRRVLDVVVQKSSPILAKVSVTSMPIVKEVVKTEQEIKEEAKEEMKKEMVEKPKTLEDRLTELGLPIGIMAAALLFFVLGLVVVRSLSRMHTQKIRVMEDQVKAQEAAARSKMFESEESAISEAVEGVDVVVDESLEERGTIRKGLEHFVFLIKEDPQRAVYLIKQWIHSGMAGSPEALAIVSRVLSVTQINQVLMLLDDAERRLWNKAISQTSLDFNKYLRADRFVAKQVLNSYINPPPPIEDSIRDLVAAITPEEGAECARRDAKLGAVLLNVLPTLQVAKMLNLLEHETMERVSELSGSLTSQQMSKLSLALSTTIKDIRSSRKAGITPFLDRVVDLIPEVGVHREEVLFNTVARTGQTMLLLKLSKEFYPAELINDLPREVLKQVFDKLPMVRRAELIISQDELTKQILWGLVGESGKMREIIEAEVDQIEFDDTRVRSILRNKNRLWKEFVDRVRQLIRSDEDIQDELSDHLASWVEDKIVNVQSRMAA